MMQFSSVVEAVAVAVAAVDVTVVEAAEAVQVAIVARDVTAVEDVSGGNRIALCSHGW